MGFRAITTGLFLVAAAFAAMPAAAQEITALTEQNVRDFIQKTSTIMSGKESDMSKEEIDAYLDEHLHKDAKFKSTMQYAVPGFEVQKKTMSLDKKDFMDSIHHAEETVSDYESIIDISDIKISKDGKNATVKTRTMESGTMPVADDIEKAEVPMEGMSSCTQIIKLSDENVIQMFNATCVTDVSFQMFEP